MFQFTGLTSDIIGYSIARVGCPIRIFTDQRLFAPPRNFSQLITSFIVSESQGIPRTPLLTFFYNYTYRLILKLKLVCLLFVYFYFPNMSKNFNSLPSPGLCSNASEPDCKLKKTLRNSKLMCGYQWNRTIFIYMRHRISLQYSSILRTFIISLL